MESSVISSIADRATIAAVATAKGCGGIGILRISGPQALHIAQGIFSRGAFPRSRQAEARRMGSREFESHRVYYGHIIAEASAGAIDEVLMTFMQAPRSYTREDVVEISSHGGASVLQAILELVVRGGARLAEPGEFTLRAFLNGRIDLTQAEAVMDLIQARSTAARQIAVRQIGGELRSEIEAMRRALTDSLSRIEVGIDFPEAIEEEAGWSAGVRELSARVQIPLERIVRSYRDGRVLREGISALIVGRPNVGKSSLLNRLVNMERAIVTDIPGTTRDFILESFQFNGTAVNVIDTAGFQHTDDPIENMGMRKTLELVEGADVVLLVVEAGVGLCEAEERIFDKVREKKVIVVQNKCDLLVEGEDTAPAVPWEGVGSIGVSAKTGLRIEDLRAMILAVCAPDGTARLEGALVPNLRQARRLQAALECVRRAVAGVEGGASCDLIAVDLKEALESLEECLGQRCRADILEEIFARFCIGK